MIAYYFRESLHFEIKFSTVMRTSGCISTILYLATFFTSGAAGQDETLYEKRERVLDKARRECREEMQRALTQQLSIGERLNITNRKLDTEVMMQLPDSSTIGFEWGQYLIPIPTCLGVLSNLILSATHTADFPLNETDPIGGFKYMKNPESFRLSLLQVSRESYRAFLTAHTNMDKIRVSAATIPGYIKEAVKILSIGNFSLQTKNKLEPPLTILKRIISDNLEWSLEVGTSFERLGNLTEEVHLTAVSSINSKKAEEEKLNTTSLASNLKFDSIQQLVDNVESRLKSDAISQTRTIEEIQKTFNSIPSGISLVFMPVVEYLFVKPLSGILKAIQFITGYSSKNTNQPSAEVTSSPPPNDYSCLIEYNDNINDIYFKSKQFMNRYYNALRFSDSLPVPLYNATKDVKTFRNNLKNAWQCSPVNQLIQMGIKTFEATHKLTHELIPTNMVIDVGNKSQGEFQLWKDQKILPVRKSISRFFESADNLRKKLADEASPLPNKCLIENFSYIIDIFSKSKLMVDQYKELKSIDSANSIYNSTKDAEFFTELSENVTLCEPVVKVIEMGMEVFQQMHELANVKRIPIITDKSPTKDNLNSTGKNEKFKAWREREFQYVNNLINIFHEAASSLKTLVSNVPETTFDSIIESELDNIGGSSNQKTLAIAYYKIGKHSNALKVLSETMDRNRKLLIEKSEESLKILSELQKLEAKQIDVKRTIEMLEVGLEKLSELKTNWSQLTIFFVGIKQVIETVTGNSLKDLMDHLETTAESKYFKRKGEIHSEMIKLALEKVMKVNHLNTKVHAMASTYCNISNEYLMATIHNLDSMMEYKSRQDLTRERSKLLESSAKNAQKIGEVLDQEKIRMAEKIRIRGRQVRQEYAFLTDLIEVKDVGNEF